MILALESSCDETALALFDPAVGLRGEWLHSQIALHEQHGGVVPDLAAREHLRHFAPLLRAALTEMGFAEAGSGLPGGPDPVGTRAQPAGRGAETGSAPRGADPWQSRGSTLAVTYGPGLAPCLALGVAAAKSLGLALGLPVVGVNHLRGHVWSPFIPLHAENPATFAARTAGLFPHLSLLVSGGHTLLARVEEDRSITLISSTRDDAAGEALDKGAKLLGLGYPGGPLIEERSVRGKGDAFDFPRGLPQRDELAFSFSGLKTSLRYVVEKLPPAEAIARRDDLCASYQEAVVDALARKTRAALAGQVCRSLGLSGGVARNGALRQRLEAEARRAGAAFLPVLPQHAGDNAAMIAFAAWMDPKGTLPANLDLSISPSLALAP